MHRMILAALVVLAGALAVAPAASGHPAPPLVRLSAPGGPSLVDGFGRQVELHGVNLVAKCPAAAPVAAAPGTPCSGAGTINRRPLSAAGAADFVLTPAAADPGRRFTAADARTLAGLGFSVVRLGIIWAGLEPGPAGVMPNDPRYCAAHVPGTPFPALGAADPYQPAVVARYLHRVDTIVGLLRAAGLRVILDMHQDAWGAAFANPASATPWRGEGAPLWATCTDGLPFGAPDRWQSAYTDPAVSAALDTFWANDARGNLQGQYARVWRAVATHFAGNPAVIGYELFNEPNDFSTLVPGSFDRKLQCLYAGALAAPVSCAATTPPQQSPVPGLIGAIEAADPHGLVFFEPPVLSEFGVPETVGIAESLPFRRLVLSYHVYGSPTLATHQFSCTSDACGTSEQSTVGVIASEREATRTRQPRGPAVFLTEFGAESAASDVARVAALADARSESWTEWAAFELHDPTGAPDEGIIDERTRRPVPALARALARVYPLATAGQVTAQAYDPRTRRFIMTWSPDRHVAAPTEIVVPAYSFPRGYHVAVHGARVVSRRGAPRLLLRALRGARTASVAVTP